MRGRTQLRLAAALGLPGLVILVVGIIVFVTQSVSKVDGFQRVSLSAGKGQISFSDTGKYVVYYEASDVNSSITYVPAIELSVKDSSTGAPVTLTPYGGRSDGQLDRFTYSYSGHHGVAYREFRIDKSGTYDVSVQGENVVDPAADMAFGPSITAGTVAGPVLMFVGGALFVAGLVLMIIGLARRSGHKKQLARGYGPPAYPGGYPPQQQGWYPQQGWQQQQPPQQGGWPPQQ